MDQYQRHKHQESAKNENMKIGILLPAVYAVGNPFNGVREQAYFQADALEALGHDVVRMNSWEKYTVEDFDIVHFFAGGPPFKGIEGRTPRPVKNLVLAPIIDTRTPNHWYRMSMLIGRTLPKIETIQSYYRAQADSCALVIARSVYEQKKLVEGLGVDPSKVKIVLNGCPATVDNPNPELCREKFGIEGDFVFHLSRITNLNKNVVNMIKGIGPTGIPLIIGGTHIQDSTYAQIESLLKKFPNVRLVGRVSEEEKLSLYSACRVFCLPSDFEGTGLVAVEAASYGAKIVITEHGGPPDYFEDFAWYVKTGTAEEIRKHTVAAFESAPGNELSEHVKNKLTWENSAISLATAYSGI